MGSGSVGALGVDLLGTKIAPPTLPRGFLRRRRLEERLDTGVSGPVTLVSAGPGLGKTLAVASWAHTHRMTARTKLAWLALDRDDNDPSLFWGAVIASLQASGAVAADHPLAALGRAVSAEGLQRLRSGFARLPAPSVLVLDDFQVIDHPDILESIAVLLAPPITAASGTDQPNRPGTPGASAPGSAAHCRRSVRSTSRLTKMRPASSSG